MNLELEGSVVFIAGSSQGIGLAISEAFLKEGASVVISGRRPDVLDQATRRLAEASDPSRVMAVQGDLTDPVRIQEAVEQVLARFKRLDAVVANIGSGVGPSGWHVTPKEWQASLQMNLLGSVQLADAVLKHLVRQRAGSLTFISSIAGCEALGAPVPYSAAKAALHSTMKSLSRAVGPHGVRVNAVAPGNILFPGGSWDRYQQQQSEQVAKYIQREVPLGRFGRVDEVADAAVFLASTRASFLTGACLVVDGGQTRGW